jgi:hypothetical protein
VREASEKASLTQEKASLALEPAAAELPHESHACGNLGMVGPSAVCGGWQQRRLRILQNTCCLSDKGVSQAINEGTTCQSPPALRRRRWRSSQAPGFNATILNAFSPPCSLFTVPRFKWSLKVLDMLFLNEAYFKRGLLEKRPTKRDLWKKLQVVALWALPSQAPASRSDETYAVSGLTPSTLRWFGVRPCLLYLLGIGVWDANRFVDSRNPPCHQGV